MKPLFLAIAVAVASLTACSSGPQIKQQKYARLQNSKDFEEDYDVVWKAMMAAAEDYKTLEKDAASGIIVTDWVYATSNEKYYEYTVNGLPRKHYLQARYKISMKAVKKLGSVNVTVSPIEQVEKVRSDGTFDDWTDSEQIDSARANDILKKVEEKILARH